MLKELSDLSLLIFEFIVRITADLVFVNKILIVIVKVNLSNELLVIFDSLEFEVFNEKVFNFYSWEDFIVVFLGCDDGE